MILNLLRIEDVSVEDMIKQSFSEFAAQKALKDTGVADKVARGEKILAKLNGKWDETAPERIGLDDLPSYWTTAMSLLKASKTCHRLILSSGGGGGGGVLTTGRVICVTNREHGLVAAPACVIKPPEENKFVVVALYRGDPDTANDKKEGELNYIGTMGTGQQYIICEVDLSNVLYCTDVKKKFDASAILSAEKKKEVAPLGGGGGGDFFGAAQARGKEDDFFGGKKAAGGKKGASSGSSGPSFVTEIEIVTAALTSISYPPPLLDLKDCVRGVKGDPDYIRRVTEYDRLVEGLFSYASHTHVALHKHWGLFDKKQLLRARVDRLKHLMSNESLELFPDFVARKNVLLRLGYIDEEETVELKGRCAVNVNTCESLILTEMIFDGLLDDLGSEEIAALLSCLVFQQRTDADVAKELPEALKKSIEGMKEVGLRLGQVQKEEGLPVVPADYANEHMQFGLVTVAYEWACGMPFNKICELTEVQEGVIVRTLTRLDELIRECRNSARIIGNPVLYQKCVDATDKIKRDICFSSSLYLS